MKKKMDLNRYERVAGREALKQMLDGKHAYFISLTGGITSFFFDNNYQLKGETETGEIFKPEVTVTEIIERYNWYIKKTFDVRTEMLARPNEWVGAFENKRGQWFLVGFDKSKMSAARVRVTHSHAPVDCSHENVCPATDDEIDKCVSIEDVLEEN